MADVSIAGTEDSTLSYALDTAGDFDGDGNDDLVTAAGSTALGFYGPLSGALRSPEASFIVSATESPYSLAVSSVGDVSGDGTDDLAIGDTMAADGAGAVYLFYTAL